MNGAKTVRCLVATVLLLAAAACATSKQVQDIVQDSNAAIEAAAILRETSDPELRAVGLDGRPAQRDDAEQRLQAAVAKIDAFLAEHGDLEVTANALVLRKAVLLLVAGKPNMAKASFAAYDPNLPGNARDLGLYHSHEVLTWWWSVAAAPNPDLAAFDDRTRELTLVIEQLPGGSGVRHFLATLRAQIYLKWATLETDRRTKLQEGLSLYSAEFDERDRGNVESWVAGRPGDVQGLVSLENLRYLAQVKITFDEYASVYRRFLLETREAQADSPQDLPPELREIELEEQPLWPEDCRWIVELGPG